MTNERIREAVAAAYEEIVTLRRVLHANPEMGNKEFATAALIKKYLLNLGLEAENVLETGIVGTLVLGAGTGPVVALRADIDALPIMEETGLSYASKNQGMMHACGHDIHTAALLGAAKILAQNGEGLNGTVKFLFQPDEEGDGGAKRMIEAGVLENPRVDKVFGIHIRPEIPAGKIAVKYGKSYAASDMFQIEVAGKSCHGAEPENGISAIRGAAEIVTQLDGLAQSLVPEGEKAVLSIGSLVSGTAGNIIPGRAVLKGIIRTLGQDSRAIVKNAFVSTVNIAAESQGCTAEIKIKESYPGVVNHDTGVALVERCAMSLFGEYPIVLEDPTMTTEDFGYFLLERPGCFYHIGAGCEYPLHNSKLAPDEACLEVAVMMHVKTVVDLMRTVAVEPVQPAEPIAEAPAEAPAPTEEPAPIEASVQPAEEPAPTEEPAPIEASVQPAEEPAPTEEAVQPTEEPIAEAPAEEPAPIEASVQPAEEPAQEMSWEDETPSDAGEVRRETIVFDWSE